MKYKMVFFLQIRNVGASTDLFAQGPHKRKSGTGASRHPVDRYQVMKLAVPVGIYGQYRVN